MDNRVPHMSDIQRGYGLWIKDIIVLTQSVCIKGFKHKTHVKKRMFVLLRFTITLRMVDDGELMIDGALLRVRQQRGVMPRVFVESIQRRWLRRWRTV
jgi:hypothetical protein